MEPTYAPNARDGIAGHAVSDYCKRRCYMPRPYRHSQHRSPVDYEQFRSPDVKRGDAPSLGLIDHLQSTAEAAFAERVAALRPGRESVYFAENATVARLAAALRRAGASGKLVVENYLDTLFEAYRVGETFTHTESVMSILYALKAADVSYAADVINVFAQSEMAEVGPIRRFAVALTR